MKTWQFILILILLCGLGIFLLLIFLGYVLKIPKKETGSTRSATVPPSMSTPRIDPARDTIMGSRTAPVTIVAYMDFGCAHCTSMSTILDTLLAREKEAVRLVWKDVPRLTQQGSIDAHVAGRCAHEQNRFADYRRLLYERQPNFSSVQLRTYATTLGLNLPRFTACQEREDHRTQFGAIREEVDALGLTGTPTVFINNKRVDGEVSLETLQNIISTAKNKK
ncbi:thioredoxin domain-containing protein [Candidatus Uhrbacteria bacterium]|nr:thioredoxin domain-containing protein [Candidatus Uhrbacteria bacterium]